MNEGDLISRLKSRLGVSSARVEVGIGDDAAILGLAHSARPVLCSDLMVEGVHFDLRYASAEDVGFKALASCLSDVAAMNGRAVAALVSLALPREVNPEFLEDFYRGASLLASSCGCDIVGGDLSKSPGPIFIDVACYGETGHPILRSGAKSGDLVAVSGTLGGSAAALHEFQNGRIPSDSLKLCHLRPLPRFDLVVKPEFAQSCTSLIDVSDGLASELGHLVTSSKVGFEIEAAKIPLHPDAVALHGHGRALEWALHGGEDYQLLATFLPGGRIPDGFTVIGRTVGDGLTLVQPNGAPLTLDPRGYDHFRT